MNWGIKTGSIPFSRLHDSVMGFTSQGVIRVDFTSPTGNIEIGDKEFPRLIDITGLGIEEVDDVR